MVPLVPVLRIAPGTGDPGTGDLGTGNPGTGDPGNRGPGDRGPGTSEPIKEGFHLGSRTVFFLAGE